MSHRLSLLNRVISLLLGVLLTLGSVWAVAYASGHDLAAELVTRFDWGAIETAVDSRWFPLGLSGIALLGLGGGGWLISANLRRRTINRMPSPFSDETGEIQLSATRLAAAVGAGLAEYDGVAEVRHSVAWDRRRPTATWLISAQAGVDLPALIEEIEETDRDVHEALGGIELATSYRLNLRPVENS